MIPACAALAIDAALLTFAGGDTRIDGRLPDLAPARVPAIRAAQTVSTGREHAELLFGSASFLRLAPDSRIHLGSMRLDGTAILHLAEKADVRIACEDAVLRFTRSGAYRLDCAGDPALAVRRGAALVSIGARQVRVGAGRTLQLHRAAAPARTLPRSPDAFDRWCAGRARRAESLHKADKPLSTSMDIVLRDPDEIDRRNHIPRP